MRARDQIALQAQLLDEVDAAVILVEQSGKQGVVCFWSAGAQRLYGYTAEEAVGRDLRDLVMAESGRAMASAHGAAVRAGETIEDEAEARDKHGRVFPVDVRIRPVPPAAGLGPGLVVTVSADISVRREAEAAAARHAQGQQEIVNLGRLALRERLYAGSSSSRRSTPLRGSCPATARVLLERLPDADRLMLRAAVRVGARACRQPDGHRGAPRCWGRF